MTIHPHSTEALVAEWREISPLALIDADAGHINVGLLRQLVRLTERLANALETPSRESEARAHIYCPDELAETVWNGSLPQVAQDVDDTLRTWGAGALGALADDLERALAPPPGGATDPVQDAEPEGPSLTEAAYGRTGGAHPPTGAITEIARIIAPSAFYRKHKGRLSGDVNPADRAKNRERALAKARAVLALYPASPPGGVGEGPDDLTTPMEPNALYLFEADIVSFQTKDVVTVARRRGERFDVLLSMDRTEVVGFQVWGARTFGEWLLNQNPTPAPPLGGGKGR